jgi:hypothetical protein
MVGLRIVCQLFEPAPRPQERGVSSRDEIEMSAAFTDTDIH